MTNPKHLSVRLDRNTGDFWLTEERYRQPIKRLRNITQDIMLTLCADMISEDETLKLIRDVKFSDGTTIRITVEAVNDEPCGPVCDGANTDQPATA